MPWTAAPKYRIFKNIFLAIMHLTEQRYQHTTALPISEKPDAAGAPASRNESEFAHLLVPVAIKTRSTSREMVSRTAIPGLAAQSINLIKGYRDGSLEIVLNGIPTGRMRENDFDSRAIRNGRTEDCDGAVAALNIKAPNATLNAVNIAACRDYTARRGTRRHDPSLYGPNPQKTAQISSGKPLALPLAFWRFATVSAKGKRGILGKTGAGSDSGGVANLIKRRAQSFDCFRGRVDASYRDGRLRRSLCITVSRFASMSRRYGFLR